MGNKSKKNKNKMKNVQFSNANREVKINDFAKTNDEEVKVETKEVDVSNVIRNDEAFDIKAYQKTEKENKKARMTDDELRESIINYKVPELDIPDFTYNKNIKGESDNDERGNLLDKLMAEETVKPKNKKKNFKEEVQLFDEEIKEEKTKEKVKPKVVVTEKLDRGDLAKKKQENVQNGCGKTTVRKDENKEVVKEETEKVEIKPEVKKPHVQEIVIKPVKKQKKLKVGKLVNLIIILGLIIALIICGIKYIPSLLNLNAIKVSKELPDEFAISDYTEAPLTNYGIYKTIPDKVRGVYISEYTIASSSNVDKWIKICKESELNALVINVKNDDGLISFEVDYDDAKAIGADANRTIKDPAELTLKLKQNGIWPIARIVAFKDPYLASKRSDLALKDSSGSVLQVKSGSHYENWVNPYNKDLWDYVVNVSKCALDMGFKEIQYDYIRFGTGTEMKNAAFGFESNTKTKRDIIIEFSKYAKQQISAYGGYLAADVFGTIITSDYDAEIVGQNYLEMGKIYDFLCPMVYASHYANGSLGVEYPDLDPYNLVKKALEASNKVLDQIPEGEHRATVRAWLQDFTATWVSPHQTYGPTQIREQKQAIYDSGNKEWLLWNASNNYSLGGLD